MRFTNRMILAALRVASAEFCHFGCGTSITGDVAVASDSVDDCADVGQRIVA